MWGHEICFQCEKNNLHKPVSIQNAYNLINRSFEESLSETCFRENIGLLPYSPLAFGYLTGKYIDDPNAKGRINDFEGFDYRYKRPNTQPAIKEYVELARDLNMSPTQMALAFVNDRSFVTSNIIGATNLDQLKENIESAKITLDKKVLKKINEIHLKYPNPAP